jgi:putative ATPase
VLRKREIQAAVVLGDSDDPAGSVGIPGGGHAGDDVLTWTAASKGREGWFKRLESGRSKLLLADRDCILSRAAIARHDRVLVAAANDGLLLWESLRLTPEGLTAAIVDSEAAKDALLRFAATLDGAESYSMHGSGLTEIDETMPVAVMAGLPGPEDAEALFGTPVFDRIVAREPWRRMVGGFRNGKGSFGAFAEDAKKLLEKDGRLVILQSPPRLGERISRVLAEGGGENVKNSGVPPALIAGLAQAEQDFFSLPEKDWSWDEKTLETSFQKAGFSVKMTVLDQAEERILTPRDLSGWFDKDRSAWGAFIAAALGEKDFQTLKNLLEDRVKQGPLQWKWKSLLLTASVH